MTYLLYDPPRFWIKHDKVRVLTNSNGSLSVLDANLLRLTLTQQLHYSP